MYAPPTAPPLFTNFRRTEMIKQINPDRDDPNWLDTEVGDVWNDIDYYDDEDDCIDNYYDDYRAVDDSIPRIPVAEFRV